MMNNDDETFEDMASDGWISQQRRLWRAGGCPSGDVIDAMRASHNVSKKGPSGVSAVDYNQVAGSLVGWHNGDDHIIPDAACDDYEALGLDPVTEDQMGKDWFAFDVWRFQKDHGLYPNGYLDQTTWDKLLSTYAPVADEDDYIVISGSRQRVDADMSEIDYRTFHTHRKYDLSRFKHYKKRKANADVRLIVMHWGGFDIDHLARVFSTPNRKVSSHGAFGPDVFAQYYDLKTATTWHAGYVNRFSIGFDIAQQPGVSHLARYKAKDYDVEIIDHPKPRRPGTPKKILSIEPRTLATAAAVVRWVAREVGIPLQVPRHKDGSLSYDVFDRQTLQNGEFKGIVGHFHISGRKWDPLPWWTQFAEALGTVPDGQAAENSST